MVHQAAKGGSRDQIGQQRGASHDQETGVTDKDAELHCCRDIAAPGAGKSGTTDTPAHPRDPQQGGRLALPPRRSRRDAGSVGGRQTEEDDSAVGAPDGHIATRCRRKSMEGAVAAPKGGV